MGRLGGGGTTALGVNQAPYKCGSLLDTFNYSKGSASVSGLAVSESSPPLFADPTSFADLATTDRLLHVFNFSSL